MIGVIFIKKKSSWLKPENKENLIAKKKVDWSTFRYGIHIPLDLVKYFDEANNGKQVDLGTSRDLVLLIEDKKFNVSLRNINSKEINHNNIQIMYVNNNKIKKYLKEQFSLSDNYLKSLRN